MVAPSLLGRRARRDYSRNQLGPVLVILGAMSRARTPVYRRPRRLMREQRAAEQGERHILRGLVSWVVGALLGLAILAPAQDVLAGTDSAAAASAPARDPAVRWQFDTGG